MNTTITVPSLKPKQLISVSINVPYLDMIYERVDPYLANELLSIGLSIAVNRIFKLPDAQPNGEDTDHSEAYEDLYINEFVLRAIEVEKDMMDRPQDLDIITAGEFRYYSTIVRDFINHVEEYFINTHDDRNLLQIEFLLSIIDKKEFIDVVRHAYDSASGYLYIFLEP